MPSARDILVAVVTTSTNPFGASALLNGVGIFARTQPNWKYLHHYANQPRIVKMLRRTHFDGILMDAPPIDVVKSLRSLRVPIVNMFACLPEDETPAVIIDGDGVGRTGAAHLLERGLRHFVFAGVEAHFSRDREKSFKQAIASAGFECHSSFGAVDDHRHPDWDQWSTPSVVARWLSRLPRPLGLMACNDYLASFIIAACAANGIEVPEQIAVLGVDDNELRCESCIVPLSSVKNDIRRIGYESAAVLTRLVRGEELPKYRQTVPPCGVTARSSTNVLAFDDPSLAAAVLYIRQHATERIQVEDVLRVVPISRRSLERRFIESLGHSPAEEIRRVRLHQAKEMLLKENLSLTEIARNCGYEYLSHLTAAFKQAYGMAPGAFRRKNCIL